MYIRAWTKPWKTRWPVTQKHSSNSGKIFAIAAYSGLCVRYHLRSSGPRLSLPILLPFIVLLMSPYYSSGLLAPQFTHLRPFYCAMQCMRSAVYTVTQCPSVCHKQVFFQNRWTDPPSGCRHSGYNRLTLQYIIREYGYPQNRYFPLEIYTNLELRQFPVSRRLGRATTQNAYVFSQFALVCLVIGGYPRGQFPWVQYCCTVESGATEKSYWLIATIIIIIVTCVCNMFVVSG